MWRKRRLCLMLLSSQSCQDVCCWYRLPSRASNSSSWICLAEVYCPNWLWHQPFLLCSALPVELPDCLRSAVHRQTTPACSYTYTTRQPSVCSRSYQSACIRPDHSQNSLDWKSFYKIVVGDQSKIKRLTYKSIRLRFSIWFWIGPSLQSKEFREHDQF